MILFFNFCWPSVVRITSDWSIHTWRVDTNKNSDFFISCVSQMFNNILVHDSFRWIYRVTNAVQIVAGSGWLWQHHGSWYAVTLYISYYHVWFESRTYEREMKSNPGGDALCVRNGLQSCGSNGKESFPWKVNTQLNTCPVGCEIHRLLLCRGIWLANECPVYDTKQSDCEVQ